MLELLKNNSITELENFQNAAYILNDSSLFFKTGYKILQSLEKNGLVRCARLKYNGKIKLVYFTSKYRSLPTIVPALNSGGFLSVIANLFANILDIKSNGFLFCRNIHASADKIFIDQNTLAVNMIYLPVNSVYKESAVSSFEWELRITIMGIIDAYPHINSSAVKRVREELANPATGLDRLYLMILAESKSDGRTGQTGMLQSADDTESLLTQPLSPSDYAPVNQIQTGVLNSSLFMIVTAVNTPIKTVFTVDRPEFIIGKNPDTVDGVVPNKAISRVHCKLVCRSGLCSVVDLGSANGTFVNGTRIPANQPVALNDGDILRLANSEFTISI
ncbi:MAG: FHA domain-containing protein [Oscillospiraceae bacterium]|jgi:hypothetical protein|nr:FHA domain-containing protein [Oscillospiraceae bacterium]